MHLQMIYIFEIFRIFLKFKLHHGVRTPGDVDSEVSLPSDAYIGGVMAPLWHKHQGVFLNFCHLKLTILLKPDYLLTSNWLPGDASAEEWSLNKNRYCCKIWKKSKFFRGTFNGTRRSCLMDKNGVQKLCETVPLKSSTYPRVSLMFTHTQESNRVEGSKYF